MPPATPALSAPCVLDYDEGNLSPNTSRLGALGRGKIRKIEMLS